jgi:hypothetical protein
LPRRLMPVGGRSIPQELQERASMRARQAEDRGIVLGLIRNLLPGITEWIAHPSLLSDELRSFHGHAEKRGMELDFWKDEDVKHVLSAEKIRLVGWKELQQLQKFMST